MTAEAMTMQVQYDPEADAIYIELRESEGAVENDQLDDRRMVDYDARGEAVGVELLFVSEGVDLEGLPEADVIAAALRQLGALTLSGAA